MGLTLRVGPNVLVPREETELLGRTAVEIVLACAKSGAGSPPRVIDMCCGAGNLACAVASAVPEAAVWASDLTEETTQTARDNVLSLGLEGRVAVHQGDLFSSLVGLDLEGTVDLIVCNPPYISTGRLEKDRAHLLESEPREAFDGGPYGLSIHQKVIREAPRFLRPGGALAFEVGIGQSRQVQALFDRARTYEALSLRNDANGEPRVVVARLGVAPPRPEP